MDRTQPPPTVSKAVEKICIHAHLLVIIFSITLLTVLVSKYLGKISSVAERVTSGGSTTSVLIKAVELFGPLLAAASTSDTIKPSVSQLVHSSVSSSTSTTPHLTQVPVVSTLPSTHSTVQNPATPSPIQAVLDTTSLGATLSAVTSTSFEPSTRTSSTQTTSTETTPFVTSSTATSASSHSTTGTFETQTDSAAPSTQVSATNQVESITNSATVSSAATELSQTDNVTLASVPSTTQS